MHIVIMEQEVPCNSDCCAVSLYKQYSQSVIQCILPCLTACITKTERKREAGVLFTIHHESGPRQKQPTVSGTLVLPS